MWVNSYFYQTPTHEYEEYHAIPGINRSCYMNKEYLRLAKTYLKGLELSGRVAVLYAGGVTTSSSEGRNAKDQGEYSISQEETGMALRELSAHNMHKYIGMLNQKDKVVYANINADTCASSMQSLYEAERLMNHEKIDEVIIITEDMISYNTIRVFDECGIPVKAADGLCVMHLSKVNTTKSVYAISDTKWAYEYNRNPFGVSK